MYVQNFFIPECGSSSFGVTIFSIYIKHQTMKPFNITTNGITKLLKNLNPYKAQGPDNLSPRILKELH
jgi:hypothetical protein